MAIALFQGNFQGPKIAMAKTRLSQSHKVDGWSTPCYNGHKGLRPKISFSLLQRSFGELKTSCSTYCEKTKSLGGGKRKIAKNRPQPLMALIAWSRPTIYFMTLPPHLQEKPVVVWRNILPTGNVGTLFVFEFLDNHFSWDTRVLEVILVNSMSTCFY